MEREQSTASDSEPEEIPHISTLSLAQLEASLAQQEAYSREVLGYAFAGRQEAQRHREAAIQCDANAQLSRVRYEEAELAIHELRKAIVEKNKHMLEGHLDQGHVRAPNENNDKRQRSPSPESNVSRKRVAPTNRDRRSPTVIKPEDETATLQPHANAVSIAAGDQQPLQSESSSDEDLNDESDDDKSSNDGPLNDNFDEEKSDVDSDDGEEAQKAAFRPRRAAKATALVPQVAPRIIFAHSATNHPHRMIRRDNPKKEILIYTSGHFIGKKKRKPARAGCAVIFESETQVGRPWSVKFPLEQRGPRGFQNDMDQRTAELRALVAALELRLWSTEGWEKVIIATSSIYAHRGITQNVGHWESKGWLRGVLNGDKHLKNFDLWARAIDLVNEHAYRGCEVQFWLIRPEEANDAESAARLAASAGPAPQAYQSMGKIRITWKTS